MSQLYENMLRVSKTNLCPVCGKSDWCLVAEDGTAAICQRIQEGSKKRCGDAGWLHVLSNRHNRHNRHIKRRFSLPLAEEPKDLGQLSRQYQQQLIGEKLNWLSVKLGISTKSLKRLRVGWDCEAYTFPMSNAESQIIGIRRRFPDGRKVSMIGSKTGLFIPIDLSSKGLLLICEGPTDTAAALDLGFAAIGRPNCNSKVNMTAEIVKGRDVVIIGDNDDGGRVGVERLSDTLALYCKDVRIVYPPEGIKDLRDWLSIGLTAEKLRDIIGNTEPIGIRISFNGK
jgi:hypothetical protein